MRSKIDAPEPKVAPAILQAKNIIEVNGWVRGALCTDDGYCVTGAIVAATTDMVVQDIAFEIIRAECGCSYVTRWNDQIAQSKKEVTRMLTRAARRARQTLRPDFTPAKIVRWDSHDFASLGSANVAL